MTSHPEIDAAGLRFDQTGLERIAAELEAHNCLVLRRFAQPALIGGILQRVKQVFDLRQQQVESGAPTGGKTFKHGILPYLGLRELDTPEGPPYQILGLVAASALLPLLHHLTGEVMYCNVGESAARRVLPQQTGLYLPFHQDGFFNHQAHWPMINCWVPLVPCGRDAPGLDLLPVGLQYLLEPTAEERQNKAPYAFAAAEAYCLEHAQQLWHPELLPGDILLMNPYAIHRTYGHPYMKNIRYSLELRFTAGDDIPTDIQAQYQLFRMP